MCVQRVLSALHAGKHYVPKESQYNTNTTESTQKKQTAQRAEFVDGLR